MIKKPLILVSKYTHTNSPKWLIRLCRFSTCVPLLRTYQSMDPCSRVPFLYMNWGVPVRYPDHNDITCLQQLCLYIKLKIYLLMSWRSLNLLCQDVVYFFWRGVNNGLKSVQQWMDGSMFADYSKGVSYFFWQIMVYMYMCVQNLLPKNSYIRPPSDAFV